MFGFGKSTLEKVMIARVETALGPLGWAHFAKNIVDKAKKRTLTMVSDLSVVNWGDRLARNESYINSRKEFGLSAEDIKLYWNAGLFLRIVDGEMRNVVNVAAMESVRAVRNCGIEEAMEIHFQRVPMYGDPGESHKCFKNGEKCLPIELEEKICNWELAVGESKKDKLLNQFPSYNAMIKELISEGSL